MKLGNGIQFLITLITFTIVTSQNISPSTPKTITEVTATEFTTTKITTTPPDPLNINSYDYVVELVFRINEEKVPEYVIKLIYQNSSENDITIEDVLVLFPINNTTLTQAEDILRVLNIQQSSVFSVNGLDTLMKELELSFEDTYKSVLITRMDLSGIPLKNFLVALGIDNGQFTEGMAYGIPDPYEVFKKGNLSRASLENALKIVNKTTNELFVALRDVIFTRMAHLGTKTATAILEKYNFDVNKALELWAYLDITVNQLLDIPVFNNSLYTLSKKQNNEKFLGIMTNNTHIATNRVVYDTWKKNNIFNMYAEVLTGTDAQEINVSPINITSNIISMSLSGSLNTSLPTLETNLDDVKDCIFATLFNESLLLEAVEEVVVDKAYIDAKLQLNRTNIVVGSPLICSGKVYGLAKQLVDPNHVGFDSFYKESSHKESSSNVSSADGLVFNLLLISISLYFSRIIN